MSLVETRVPSLVRVPLWIQFGAWLLALAATVLGMCDVVAQWDREQATVQFMVLILAPILWMMIGRQRAEREERAQTQSRIAWGCALAVGATSFLTCALVGRNLEQLPPAYHDEYSYVFQAQTLLRGRLANPSVETNSELFDQMHVLNEGRMASRYYPGTGLWLAPFIAIGHPYWGYWLASAVASVFVFWAGYELGGLRVGLVSGLIFALSPGVALFSNLLLAHQPTLAGLCLFLWAFVKWQRTRGPFDAFLAGCGLSYAMLCRPATAAGFGLPFGMAFVWWLLFARKGESTSNLNSRISNLFAMGVPILIGWSVMLAYNHAVTGHWTTSPYQLYTDIYSPRHVYGFNNVLRGEKKLGPKVIEAYDRWAENLTPELAATNELNRWLASWLWTFDLLPQLIATVVVAGMVIRIDRRWIGLLASLIALHVIHIPYWYVGIMGWHYVFETAPIWCLVLGLATDLLIRDWESRARWLMPLWWWLLLAVSFAGNYVPTRQIASSLWESPRISIGVGSIRYPRRQYAEFNRWLESQVKDFPALVLIQPDPDDQHMDYVVNSPGLDTPILRARYRPGVTDLRAVTEQFPDRAIYLCQPARKSIERIR